MTAMEVLLGRRSVRSYRADSVPEETLRQILETGLYAANGGGHGEYAVPHPLLALLWRLSTERVLCHRMIIIRIIAKQVFFW